jgi:hypothetical protein
LRAKYDYVLIDSRTGVSDTSSICTVQMPDILAVFFTLNRQSIKGAAAVARSATAAVRADRNEALLVYPVPTRIEDAERERLDNAIRYARRVFAPFLMHVQPNRKVPDLDQQSRYWRDVETPYVPFYAYEEVPAAFRDEPGSRRGLLAPNERIAYWLTNQAVTAMAPQDEEARKRIVDSYSFTSEETHDIERRLPTKARNRVFDFVDKVRWQLSLRPWQYATIAITIIGLVLIWTVETSTSRYYASQLQSAWQSANDQTYLYRSAVRNALDAVDRTAASLQQNRPPDSNQIAGDLAKIREELKKTP